jgi:hypothetical protein
MQAKAKISLREGLIDLEGSEEFVAKYLEWAHTKLGMPIPEAEPVAAKKKPGGGTAKKSSGAKGGPSCSSRIEALLSEKFFDKPKLANEIAKRLEEKATPYAGNHIAAALQSLTKRGTLRRVKGEGGWQYMRP